MTKYVPIAAACLVAASPAFSQSAAPPTQSAAPAKAKLICETQSETGSRLDRKRVCHTAAEWQQIKAESRDAIEKYQQQATGTPVSG
ncbi:MAG TPA: hypothetical protein VF067_03100 [Sphingomicrobium sp.]